LQWLWDEEKNRTNKLKHRLSFELAVLVFADLLAVSRCDRYVEEERWQTLGLVGSVVILVVHTWPEYNPESDEEVGRIISARKATKYERRIYEEGDI
jgi:uncharacterized DUF497 family protein